MARSLHSDEDVLKPLREIDLKLTAGNEVASACPGIGIRDATCCNFRNRFGGMGHARLAEVKSFKKASAPLMEILAEFELDEVPLRESLNRPKPWA